MRFSILHFSCCVSLPLLVGVFPSGDSESVIPAVSNNNNNNNNDKY